MKRSLRTLPSLLVLVALLVGGSVSADIIELKSGEKIEGTVLSETDTTLTYEYMLTKKIKDTKTIQKSDIAKLTRFTPAQVEFKAKGLDKLLPTRDLLSASDYESIIQDDLRTFVAKFPDSPEAAEVKKMIETLVEEKNKVSQGQVKMKGEWLDEPTAKREQYNIEAYRLRMDMKETLADASQDHVMPKEITALRVFEELRTNFPASRQYLEAIPEALETLDAYDRRLSAMSLEYPILKEERDKARASSEQAREAIDQEERAFSSAVEAQKKAKMKWLDVYKFDIKSIDAAKAVVAKEKQILKSINLVALENEIESLNAAIRYIADGNATQAEEVMARLRPSKTTLINKKVFDEIEKKLKELNTKLAAEMKAAKAAAAAAGTSAGGEGGDDAANPIAVAMKKKEAVKAKEDAKKAEKAKADAANAARLASAAQTTVEEQTLLQKINSYIPYVGAGLLVILILAMVMGKKKKEEED